MCTHMANKHLHFSRLQYIIHELIWKGTNLNTWGVIVIGLRTYLHTLGYHHPTPLFTLHIMSNTLSLKRNAPWIPWLRLRPRVKVQWPRPGHIWSWEFETGRKKTLFKNVKWFSWYLEKSKGMSCFGIRKTAQIPLQSMQIWYFFEMLHFFWPRVYGIESLGTFLIRQGSK